MVVHKGSANSVQQRAARYDDDSLTRRRRKQQNTRKWVLDQGLYEYPSEQESGELAKHDGSGSPIPQASLASHKKVHITQGTRYYSGTKISAALSSRKQRNMSSDIATSPVDKVDGAVNRKNLSSAGAAASLKRAEPRQLPSFPSHGLSDPEASAGAAASLAAAHHKTVEHWKPDRLPAAGAAASLAQSYMSREVSKAEPPASASASAASALQEAKDYQLHKGTEALGGRGSRAASGAKMPDKQVTMAGKAAAKVGSGSPSSSPRMRKLRMVKTTDEDGPSLTAATGAMSQSSKARSRAGSLPSQYPQSSTVVNHALTAASLAHKPSARTSKASSDQSQQGYDIDRINKLAQDKVTGELHGNRNTHNPQALEDRKRMDARKAASLSMPKSLSKASMRPEDDDARRSMPTTMRRSQGSVKNSPPMGHADPSQSNTSELNWRASMMAASAATAHLAERHRQEQQEQEEQQENVSKEAKARPYYHNLDEAARKQAAERLRRLAEDHEVHRRGLGLAAARYQGQQSHHRAGSDSRDAESSRRIKSEMDTLSKRMAEVDRVTQVRDSAALLAKAQQNVQKQMQCMDDKVAQDKGQIPKHLQEQWDARAREASLKAENKRHEDEAANQGKIDIGGGVWFSRDELNKRAQANVKPLLDDIEEAATVQRAKEEEVRLEKEENERKKKLEADRKKEIKQDERNAKLAAKQVERQKKEQEKQEKIHKKEEARKAKEEEKEQKKHEQEFVEVLSAGAAGGIIADMEEHGEEQPAEHDKPAQPRSVPEPPKATVIADKPLDAHGKEDKESWLYSIGRKLSRKGKEKREPGRFSPAFGGDAVVEERTEIDQTSMRDVALAGTERADTFVSEASQPLNSDNVSEVSSISREETRTSFMPVTVLSPSSDHSSGLQDSRNEGRAETPRPTWEEKGKGRADEGEREEEKGADEVHKKDDEEKENVAPLTSATFIQGVEVEPSYEHQQSSSSSIRSAKSGASRPTSSHHSTKSVSSSHRSKEDSKRLSFVGLLTKPFRGWKDGKEEDTAKQGPEGGASSQTSPVSPEDDKGTRDTFGNMFRKLGKKNETDTETKKQHREAEVPDVTPIVEQEQEKGVESSENEFAEATDFFDENSIDMPCRAQRAFEGSVRSDPSSEVPPSDHQKGDHSEGIQSRFSEDF